MRKLSCTVALPLLAVIAACASTDTETDTQTNTQTDGGARTTWLPTGMLLLQLDRGRCDGTVRIDHDSVAGDQASDIVIGEGQNAVFPIADDDIRWACVSDADTDSDVVECPDDASQMRIARAAAEEVLFECYGMRR
jgi:hypothetical protein